MQDYQILADLFGRYHEKSAGNPDEMACKPCKENWREFSIRREGESKMSLDAIEKVTEIEQQMRELRANADAQVQKVKADAERDGQARLVQARAAAAEEGKALMKAAESRAAQKAEEIQRNAEKEADTLRKTAEQRLEEAAEFIVGRVVNQ